jgi:hypothetical protein
LVHRRGALDSHLPENNADRAVTLELGAPDGLNPGVHR